MWSIAQREWRPITRRLYTYAEFVAELPDTTKPSELVDGGVDYVATPSFNHQKVVFYFSVRFIDGLQPANWVSRGRHPSTWVCLASGDAARRIFIARDWLEIIERVVMGPSTGLVAVISPGGRDRDRIEKRRTSTSIMGSRSWIMDPKSRNGAMFLGLSRGNTNS